MNTDELIAELARQVGPTQGHGASTVCTRLAIALALSGMTVLYLGLNPKLSDFVVTVPFIGKMVWLCALVAFSATWTYRMGHPGQHGGLMLWGVVLTMLVMMGLGMNQLLDSPQDQRSALWMGGSWHVCTMNIAFMALPMLAALLWSMHAMAPTRPMLAGAMSGFLSGALTAILYSLHCTENSFTFFALWYTGGIAVSTLFGALLGVRILRW